MNVKAELQQYKEIVESNEPFCIKAEAWYMMGLAYQELADFKKSLHLFQKGCGIGLFRSFCDGGESYLAGLGVKENPVKARQWYRKGADIGERTATLKLADCYKHGIGGSIDYSKALEQYLHLAERTGRFWNKYADGIGTALYEIGNMHLNGLGVPVDLKKAAHYFKLAVKKGNLNAENAIKTINL